MVGHLPPVEDFKIQRRNTAPYITVVASKFDNYCLSVLSPKDLGAIVYSEDNSCAYGSLLKEMKRIGSYIKSLKIGLFNHIKTCVTVQPAVIKYNVSTAIATVHLSTTSSVLIDCNTSP